MKSLCLIINIPRHDVAPSRETDNTQTIDRKGQLAQTSSFAFELSKSSDEKFSVNTNLFICHKKR